MKRWGSKQGGFSGRLVVEPTIDPLPGGIPSMPVTARAVQDQFEDARMEFEDLIAQ